MNAEREGMKGRLARKAAWLREALEYVDKWLSNVDEGKFLSEAMRRYVVFKAFQEAVEASMDMAALLVQLGGSPRDDRSNLDRLTELGILPKILAEQLREANSLRNWLVHRYNKINARLAFRRILELRKALRKFGEVATANE